MKYFDYSEVTLCSGYFADKERLNRVVTIPAVEKVFRDTGRFAAFDFAWKDGDPMKPHIFWDSDVAKWMEGAAYSIRKYPDPALEAKIDTLVDKIAAHQCEDGYFNIYYTVCEPGNRFRFRECHELYCAGHLIEAAVAYYEATGKRKFLDCMLRYAELIHKVFVARRSAAFKTPGHEEIEHALLRLYRVTHDPKHLETAAYFLENRDKDDMVIGENPIPYCVQSHIKPREQREAVGHAVRAGYLYTAMAEYAAETGDSGMLDACRALFHDITEKKMYITGGIGSSHIGEAFTLPYDLPNATAYSETCAAISLMMFAKAMAENETLSVYADTVEKTLYNGILSGLSLSGDAFFYENPLRVRHSDGTRHAAIGHGEHLPITERKHVFDCSCCPPNLNRVLASIGGCVYGYGDGEIYVHQFADSEAAHGDMRVRTVTDYPKSGDVKLTFSGCHTAYIRVPGWCRDFTVDVPYTVEGGYIRVEKPNVVLVKFVMPVVFIHAHPSVLNNVGKVAVMRGPVVYALEQCDNDVPVESASILVNAAVTVRDDAYFGLPCLTAKGLAPRPGESLYTDVPPEYDETELRLIPYAGFANRGTSDMCVWIRESKK